MKGKSQDHIAAGHPFASVAPALMATLGSPAAVELCFAQVPCASGRPCPSIRIFPEKDRPGVEIVSLQGMDVTGESISLKRLARYRPPSQPKPKHEAIPRIGGLSYAELARLIQATTTALGWSPNFLIHYDEVSVYLRHGEENFFLKPAYRSIPIVTWGGMVVRADDRAGVRDAMESFQETARSFIRS